MSAPTLPDLSQAFNSYAAYVGDLLAGRCDPAVATQVVDVVTGLEAALKRQAKDEIEIELRLTALEESLLHRLEAIEQAISGRADA